MSHDLVGGNGTRNGGRTILTKGQFGNLRLAGGIRRNGGRTRHLKLVNNQLCTVDSNISILSLDSLDRKSTVLSRQRRFLRQIDRRGKRARLLVRFAAKRDAALFAGSRHGLVARGVLEGDELARSICTTDQRQRLILRDCNLGAAVHDECLAAHSLVHRDGAVLICGGVEIRTAESDVLRRLVEVEIGQLIAGNIDQGAGKFKLARVQNGLSILRVNDVVLAVGKRERTAFFKYESAVLECTRINVQAISIESIREDLAGNRHEA